MSRRSWGTEHASPVATWGQGTAEDHWGCGGQLPGDSWPVAYLESSQSLSCPVDIGENQKSCTLAQTICLCQYDDIRRDETRTRTGYYRQLYTAHTSASVLRWVPSLMKTPARSSWSMQAMITRVLGGWWTTSTRRSSLTSWEESVWWVSEGKLNRWLIWYYDSRWEILGHGDTHTEISY